MKDNVHYLIRDIIGCLPNKFEENFFYTVNNHAVFKDSLKKILNEETKGKLNYKPLQGVLLLVNSYIRSHKRSAMYVWADSIELFLKCYKSKFKTMRKISGEILVRFFLILHHEHIILPGRDHSNVEIYDKWCNVINKTTFLDIIEDESLFLNFILQEHYFDRDNGISGKERFIELVLEFYNYK